MGLKNFLKPVLYILGGAALGGGISYFLAHREIKRLEASLNKLYEWAKWRDEQEISEIDEDIKKYTEQLMDDLENLNSVEAAETTFQTTPLNTSIQKPNILDLMPKENLIVDTEPFLVAENEIDLNDDKYDSEVAYTYFADGVLTDENDEIVVDPDDILPSGWRDCFGWNCRSDDTFFAINPKLRLLIEVVRAGYEYNGVYHDDSWEE